MARLPSVKLRNRKTGKVVKVNYTDYNRDINGWSKNWEIVTIQRGDATDEEVKFSANQSDIEKFRRENPMRQKWSGDDQRAYDQRKITTGGVVVKPPSTVASGKPLR